MKKILFALLFITTVAQAQIQNLQISTEFVPLDSNSTESLKFQVDYMFSKRGVFYIGPTVRANHDFSDFYGGATILLNTNWIPDDKIVASILLGSGLNTDLSDKPVRYYVEYGYMIQWLASSRIFIGLTGKRQHYGKLGNAAGMLTGVFRMNKK